MKINKKYNYLYILAILAIIFIGIIMTLHIKESITLQTSPTIPPNNFITTNEVLSVPINTNLDIPVTIFNGFDYFGNDIQNHDTISYSDCIALCANNNLCKGIVTNFKGEGPGSCSLKSNMTINTIDLTKNATKFNR
jgi:hypothetical protein